MKLWKNDSEEKNKAKESNGMDLTVVISNALKLPGVKVSRDEFLRETFKEYETVEIEQIIAKGPVEAGCTREDLKRKANKIIKDRTAISTGASFVAGIPGGIAMAATIPADLLQFYGVALRMAQELVYLYGETDIWCDGAPDPDKVTNQLILYCGVMLGVSGASQAVRIMSSALAKQALKKLPQMALTKTFYYPVIKSVLKFFGVSVTKSTFAKGVSKVIPIVGGVVSGGITLASMLPMGNRLGKTLDEAHFTYTQADFEADWRDISNMENDNGQSEGVVHQLETSNPHSEAVASDSPKENMQDEPFEKIEKAKRMLDMGMISEEEFAAIKEKIISQM